MGKRSKRRNRSNIDERRQNANGGSTGPHQSSNRSSGHNDSNTFARRKRKIDHVSFVYPKDASGQIGKYEFGKKTSDETSSTKLSDAPSCRENSESDQSAQKLPTQSLNDILYGSKETPPTASPSAGAESSASGAGRDPKSNTPTTTTTTTLSENSSSSKTIERDPEETPQRSADSGHLSGLSVEDAVRDKVGCRPRANSTDGELALPQRGLCDERTVLNNYKWSEEFLNARKRVGAKGFTNLGNTCFLNSTLQCLAYLPPFTQSLVRLSSMSQSDHSPKKPTAGKRITQTLSKLFHQVHCDPKTSSAGAIAPRGMVKAVPTLSSCGSRHGYKFRPGRQEDAHEFLVHLLDAMNDGELRAAGINQHSRGWRDRLPISRIDETTFIHRIFGGYLRSQVKCTHCGYCSNTYDPFLDLSLEVSRKSCRSLSDALQEYTRRETLDSDNKWKCTECGKRVCAQKQLTIFRPPLSLCIQLKRFAFSGFGGVSGGFLGRSGMGRKISRPIQFPSKLKLPLSDQRSCPYILTGVVIHVGNSASSGHYTACVRKPGTDSWYHMDDSYVQTISEKSVLQQADGAYLLFYSRKEVKLEFPTPPLKTMTTEQAVQRSRARERSRSESFSKQNSGEQTPTVSKQPLDAKASSESHLKKAVPKSQRLPITESAIKKNKRVETPKESDESLPSRFGDSDEITENTSKSTQKETMELNSARDSPNTSTLMSSESSLHPASSPSSENDASQPGTMKSSESTKSSSKALSATGSRSEADNGADARSERPTPVALSKKFTPHAEDSDDTSSSDDDSSSGSSSSSSSSSSSGSSSSSDGSTPSKVLGSNSSGTTERPSSHSGKNSASVPKMKSVMDESGHDQKLQNSILPISDADVVTKSSDVQTRVTAPVNGSKPQEVKKTKIVLDRGAGRGKVEVMMGPRKKKSWKPSSTFRNADQEFDLLGNKAVGGWSDKQDSGKESIASAAEKSTRDAHGRSEIVQKMEKQASTRKRKMFADRWDAMLDQGKKKKVKAKKDSRPQGHNEAFQRIQNGVMRMNKGRAKGYARQRLQKGRPDGRKR